MRSAILSTIYGNLFALNAVLSDITAQKPDRLICLGDTVGYGPHPAECLDLVREHCAIVLAGRYEFAVFHESSSSQFNSHIRLHLNWTRSVLEPTLLSLPSTRNRWNWLKTLPSRFDEGDVAFAFGTPRDPLLHAGENDFDADHILGEDFEDHGMGVPQRTLDCFAAVKSFCFIGNTNRPGVATLPGWLRAKDPLTYSYKPSEKYIVNVGSVGQPRDCDPRSCYVIFDDTQHTIEFRKIPYDIARAQAEFRKVPSIHTNFSERLAKGV